MLFKDTCLVPAKENLGVFKDMLLEILEWRSDMEFPNASIQQINKYKCSK
jgi:hypothetical protein